MLAALLERLRSVSWDWEALAAERIVAGFAGDPVERVPGRTSYRFEGLEDVSLYLEGSQADCLEITIESFREPHLLSAIEYEERVDEYFHKYRMAVAEGNHVLGPPVFDDGAAAPGFPTDQDAVWLALWRVNSARLMIEQKHEDKELPLRLCVVVTPPNQARTEVG